MRRTAPVLLCATALLGICPASGVAAPTPAQAPVVLAFLPDPSYGGATAAAKRSPGEAFQAELASAPGLSVGIVSATQGVYIPEQLLLDITQGARISSSAYGALHPPPLTVRQTGAGGVISGWAAARRRAEGAPQLLLPGLLASAIPGGGAYAGITGQGDIDALAGADRAGRIALLSLGAPSTLLERIAVLGRRRRLVVADLPGGAAGREDLRALAGNRATARVLIVLERPAGGGDHELLWAGIAGLRGGGSRELSSPTTNDRGLIAAIDIAPTILTALHITPLPADMRGFAIVTDGPLDAGSLRAELSRLEAIGGGACARSASCCARLRCCSPPDSDGQGWVGERCGSARSPRCGRRSPPSSPPRSSRALRSSTS